MSHPLNEKTYQRTAEIEMLLNRVRDCYGGVYREAGDHIRASTSPDPVVNNIVAEMVARSYHGFRKYGVTTAENPLTLRQWLQHAKEEAMETVVYLERILSGPLPGDEEQKT